MNEYKKFLGRTDLVKNQVEREKLAEQEATSKRKRSIQQQNKQRWLKYQEQLRSELAARYFHSVQSVGGESGLSNTRSLLFDGTDDFVNVPDSSNLSFGDSSSDSPFSISAWIKLSAIGSTHYIVTKSLIVNTSAARYEYVFYVSSSGNLVVNLYDGFRVVRRSTFSSGGLVSAGTWHHVAMTYNGVGGTNANLGVKIYLNGVRIDDSHSGNNSYVAMHNTSQVFKIGETTNGNIDEVAVFNSALTDGSISTGQTAGGEIADIYNSGVPADLSEVSSLVSWWRFEEGSGTTATDSGTGSNDGSLEGDTTYSTDVPE